MMIQQMPDFIADENGDFHITYTIKGTITREMIDDFLVAAFEGGITYWCNKVEVVGDYPEGATYASDCLSRGSKLKIHDAEDNIWYELTRDKFIEAIIEELAQQECSLEEMYDNHDAGTGDNIVQRALFGKVVYG